jgi:hypothetical protein
MARTIAEITAEMDAQQAAQPELAALSSPSGTALFRLWKFVFAVAVRTLEQMFDRLIVQVTTLINQAPVSTPSWFVKKAYEFQFGDIVREIDGVLQYAILDETRRIVSRASVREAGDRLQVKVAKNGSSPGTLEPLNTAEQAQLRGYIDRIKPAGVRTEITSRIADRLRLSAEVYYEGSIEISQVKTQVEAAINNYLATLSNTRENFDGRVRVILLVDAIQQVPAVRDVVITQASGRSGAVITPFSREYFTEAGYIIAEDAPGFTLADTLTYIQE